MRRFAPACRWDDRCDLSDHAPVDEDAKPFRLLRPKLGRSAWNCCCPYFKVGDGKRRSRLSALQKITVEPARILGLDAGHLSAGALADLCIFDPDQYWTIEDQNLEARAKYPISGDGIKAG